MKLVRILRAKPAGTGSGGTGQIKSVPGITHGSRDDSIGDKDSAATLRAYANLRDRARRAISNSSIGSKGRL
jgi:hypothetical protein